MIGYQPARRAAAAGWDRTLRVAYASTAAAGFYVVALTIAVTIEAGFGGTAAVVYNACLAVVAANHALICSRTRSASVASVLPLALAGTMIALQQLLLHGMPAGHLSGTARLLPIELPLLLGVIVAARRVAPVVRTPVRSAQRLRTIHVAAVVAGAVGGLCANQLVGDSRQSPLLWAAMLAVPVAIVDEAVFRGWLDRGLATEWGRGGRTAGAVIYGLAYVGVSPALGVVLGACALVWAVTTSSTRSLHTAIVSHIVLLWIVLLMR